jgi:hypothetical protein
MPGDPWVSAVVDLQPEGSVQIDPDTMPDPAGTLSEAAAVLKGFNVEGRPRPRTGEPGDVKVSGQGSVLAKAKAYFTSTGFEVHAPVGETFSIAATKSLFEQFFGRGLVVDEETFGAPVTLDDGTRELPLDRLPPDARALIRRISFPPPLELP